MRTALLLLTFLAIPVFAASQTVWKWVDDSGVTHYSDRPVPGATKMELSSSNSSDANARTPSTSSSASEPEQPSGPTYRNFEIWKPAEGESFTNTGGVVPVNVRVDPSLQPGHNLLLYLDGRLVEDFPPGASSHELQNVPRGSHRVIAVINDPRGVRVQESSPVSFIVRQESVANPPVGPALRPPPKPRPGGAANKVRTQQPSYAALNGGRASIDPDTNLPLRKKPTPKPTPSPKDND
ncbi:MAG: DUF4124 domain-containing protein [Steroidobacter sp.]